MLECYIKKKWNLFSKTIDSKTIVGPIEELPSFCFYPGSNDCESRCILRLNVSPCPRLSGQVGDPCFRSPDCSPGLCCARHFWTRICKSVLQEGQVCTRRRRNSRGLELFQRCPCGAGLSCRALRGRNARSSPSSSLMAAAKSKFTASFSRHAAPLSSPAEKPTPSKARLHMCQKN